MLKCSQKRGNQMHAVASPLPLFYNIHFRFQYKFSLKHFFFKYRYFIFLIVLTINFCFHYNFGRQYNKWLYKASRAQNYANKIYEVVYYWKETLHFLWDSIMRWYEWVFMAHCSRYYVEHLSFIEHLDTARSKG